MKDTWRKWEDRQRLEREGDEIVEAIRQYERREEEMKRVKEEEKMVAVIVEAGVECMRQWEEEKECREADEVREMLETGEKEGT